MHIHSKQLVFSQMFVAGCGAGNCLNMPVYQTTCIFITRVTSRVMFKIREGKDKGKCNAKSQLFLVCDTFTIELSALIDLC